MINKSQMIRKLKKYGYYSLNRAPYIYNEDNKLGVYLVWPHKYYGTLERVIYVEDEEQLEKIIYEYWWFKQNKSKYDITVQLDNYETLSPQVSYQYKDRVIDAYLMQNFEKEVINKPKEDERVQALKRTAHILILILEAKFDRQLNIFKEVSEMAEKLQQMQDEYLNKLKSLSGKEESSIDTIELLEDNQDNSQEVIMTLEESLNSIEAEEELSSFIDSLVEYMQEIDLNEGHLQNTYLNIKYKYDIENYQKRLEILNNIKLKKRLFKNNKGVLDELKQIEDSNQSLTMINLNNYIKNEKQRIEENYANLNTIEKDFLGDYLIDFEKLKIEIPNRKIKEIKEETKDAKNLKTEIVNSYEALAEKEKCACIIANSFLRKLLYDLKKIPNLEDLETREIESILEQEQKIEEWKRLYKIIDNFENIKIRVKYMKILKTSTLTSFIESMKEVVGILNNIRITVENLVGYSLDTSGNYIDIQLKNIWAKNKKNVNIVKLEKEHKIYYCPITIKCMIDVETSNILEVKELENIFIFKDEITKLKTKPLEKVAIWEKDNIIKEKDYIEITNARLKNICSYKFLEIK